MNETKRRLLETGLSKAEAEVVATFLLERRAFHSIKKKEFKLPADFSTKSNQEKGAIFEAEFYDRVGREVAKFLNANVFDGSDFFSDENKREAVKEEVCSLYCGIVSPYAKSASMHIDVSKYGIRVPFGKGAMKKIVVTKELGADGSYNTKYTSVGSGLEVVYDKNGNVILDNVGAGMDFAVIAQSLWNKGINWQYLERADVWFEQKGLDGKTPEQSVSEFVIMPSTDTNALDMVKELQEIAAVAEVGVVVSADEKLEEVDEIVEVEEVTAKTEERIEVEEDVKEADAVQIKRLDWELQPKSAEEIDAKDVTDFSREELAKIKDKIKNGEELSTDEMSNLDNLIRDARDADQTMVDAWKGFCYEVPEAYQYVPTKYFQGEHSPVEQIAEGTRAGMLERINGKAKISKEDVDMVNSFVDMVDAKNQLEQERIAEFEANATTKQELIDKINDAGRSLR